MCPDKKDNFSTSFWRKEVISPVSPQYVGNKMENPIKGPGAIHKRKFLLEMFLNIFLRFPTLGKWGIWVVLSQNQNWMPREFSREVFFCELPPAATQEWGDTVFDGPVLKVHVESLSSLLPFSFSSFPNKSSDSALSVSPPGFPLWINDCERRTFLHAQYYTTWETKLSTHAACSRCRYIFGNEENEYGLRRAKTFNVNI